MKKLLWLALLLPMFAYAHDPAAEAALDARISAIEEVVNLQHPPYDQAIHGARNTTQITTNCLQGEWEFYDGAEWWPNGVSFRADNEFHLIADVSYYRVYVPTERNSQIQAVMNNGTVLTLAVSFNGWNIANGCQSQLQQLGML